MVNSRKPALELMANPLVRKYNSCRSVNAFVSFYHLNHKLSATFQRERETNSIKNTQEKKKKQETYERNSAAGAQFTAGTTRLPMNGSRNRGKCVRTWPSLIDCATFAQETTRCATIEVLVRALCREMLQVRWWKAFRIEREARARAKQLAGRRRSCEKPRWSFRWS